MSDEAKNFQVGDKVTTDYNLKKKDLVRTIKARRYYKYCGSGVTFKVDPPVTDDGEEFWLDSGWFKRAQ